VQTLSIQLHASTPPEFQTSDPSTVEAVHIAYPVTPALVLAHDLASLLRTIGRKHWADVLEGEEEASMVRVVVGAS
jgi:pyruvate/2-oxoacid:ferredoxin oxidoreductase alpha subunit